MKRDSYYDFKLKIFNWLDDTLKNRTPENGIAFCFILSECEDCNWKLELKDSESDPFVWQEPPRSKQKFILNKVFLVLLDYLNTGKYGYDMQSKKCVSVGFVDGDLLTVHTRKHNKPYISKHLIYAVSSLLFLSLIYLADVFALGNPYQHNLFRFIILCASIIIFFFKLAYSENKELTAIEKDYSEEIGLAFRYDKKSKIKLLEAIKYYNKGNFLKCLKKLNKAYDKANELPDRQAVELFSALTCEEIDSTENAIQAYNGILRENPINLTALNNLAVIYSKNKEYHKAIHYASTAANAGRDPYAYNTLATVNLKLFDLDGAKICAQTVLKLKPNFVQAVNTLAVVYALENNSEYEKIIERAVLLGTNKADILLAIEDYKDKFSEHQKLMERVALLLNRWNELTKKETIAMILSDDFSKSIIGGKINENPPVSQNGEKMKLLAAIYCSELPENTIMPQKGVLRFYITPDEFYGADFENFNLNVQKNFKVLFDENEDAFSTSPELEISEDFPILRSRYLSFSKISEGMTLSDYSFEKTYNSEFLKDKDYEIGEEEIEIFKEQINIFNHKILGYPSFTQEDVRFEGGEFEKYDTLLFQLVSECNNGDDEIILGDSGVMQFFIPSEKLKKRDFSDILYTWDCY